MQLNDYISRHILEVHNGGNWTEVNIRDTLRDISFAEATRKTSASANTIASLVYHLNFYNEILTQRMEGTHPVINEANGFDMPVLRNDSDWEQLKENNLRSATRLAEVVRQLPEESLFVASAPGQPIRYKALHGIAEHAHYHLGQILVIRNLLRNSGSTLTCSNSL